MSNGQIPDAAPDGRFDKRFRKAGFTMLEIFIPFYMVVSGVIGWAIFSPFAAVADMQKWMFARLEISDCLAIIVPYSVVLGIVTSWTRQNAFSIPLVVAIVACVILMAIAGLLTGLFVLANMQEATRVRTPAAKRMAVIGVLIPIGFPMTIGWGMLPICAFYFSLHLALPAMLVIPVITIALRSLSAWVCRPETMPRVSG